jgi:hypothetical protein
MQLTFPSGPWWRRWNLAVRVGCVDVTPLSHLVAIAVLAWLVRESARQAPAEAALLGLTPANAPAVAVLLYGLLQGSRLVHEAGHAVVGVATGLPLTALRLTPLFMAADFPDEAVWQAPASSRRLTALAGSTAEATFGVVLLSIRAAVPRWSKARPGKTRRSSGGLSSGRTAWLWNS